MLIGVNVLYFWLVLFSISYVFPPFLFDFMRFCFSFVFSGNKRSMNGIGTKKVEDRTKRRVSYTNFPRSTRSVRVPWHGLCWPLWSTSIQETKGSHDQPVFLHTTCVSPHTVTNFWSFDIFCDLSSSITIIALMLMIKWWWNTILWWFLWPFIIHHLQTLILSD